MRLQTKESEVPFNLDISIWRLDVVPELKEEYNKETYVVLIEKYDSRYTPEGNCLIEKRLEFHKIEDIILYLDEEGILKKEEWVED